MPSSDVRSEAPIAPADHARAGASRGGAETRWRRADGTILCATETEAALLVRESWSTIRLNSTARELWDALEDPKTASELVALFMESYRISPDRCLGDIARSLEALSRAGAIVAT